MNNNKPFAQGDLLFIPVGQVDDVNKIVYDKAKPPLAARTETKHEQDKLIVGHSETGHHHYIPAGPSFVQMFGTNVPEASLLRVKKEVTLKHDRSYDQHGEIVLPAGDYVVKKQVERRPEGWARVVD